MKVKYEAHLVTDYPYESQYIESHRVFNELDEAIEYAKELNEMHGDSFVKYARIEVVGWEADIA